MQSGDYGGYRKDILTENITEREKAILICKKCKGIMKEACISERGEQLCSCCCEKSITKAPHTAFREMVSSLKCSCPLIERGCKWLGTLESCENHLDTCGYVYETCKLNCGEVLRREELEKHEKENCTQRQVKCDHCDENFISCELDGHLKKCPKMKVSCILAGCGTKITREEMELHLKHDCGMVQEMCKLGCGVEQTRNEHRIHEKENCVQRKVQCEHCSIEVAFCDNSKHLKECPLVKLTCYQCGIEKYRKDMTRHFKDDCPEEMIYCPFVKYKCLVRMKRKYIAKHLEEKEIKHLGLKLTVMEDLVNKQSEMNKKQSEEINKLTEYIEKQNKETTTEFSNTSQQIRLLYFITDTTKIIWKIENVKDYKYFSESKQYLVAGYMSALKFQYGTLSIVFPGTTIKPDRHFIAKCHIVLLSRHTINCGMIKVKQKDVLRGCERLITPISQEDIDKYSEPQFPGATEKDLTLEIFITMQ